MTSGRVLVDTDVIVAALERRHPNHAKATAWFEEADARGEEVVVAAHSLLQTYRVLTSLPVRPRVTGPDALRLLRESVLRRCGVRSASCRDHARVLKRLSRRSIVGGAVYDGLIAEVARATGAERIVTFNVADLRRVAPDLDVAAP